ncbi:hypothetical protein RB195_014608 [Necator americanus]|uniref:Reverse transcriptase domain-containing protein n=1 Tax=Necator americanus TaxID=51031 RepID=A0ABR1E0V8_NECAM
MWGGRSCFMRSLPPLYDVLGSSLSPLLFILCMDTITKEIQKQHLWTLLFADGVMLTSKFRDDLQKQVLEGSAAAIWIAPQHMVQFVSMAPN